MALALVAGCNASVTDPCKGVAGTCVALTVQSSTVSAVDSLHIVATNALMGNQTSSGPRASLPVVVALKLPAGVSGELDLHVDGILAAQVVGSGDTSVQVVDGQHTTATVTLVSSGGVGDDLSTGGGSDMADGGVSPDMVTPPCDPKGVTGPQCVWRWQTPLPQGDNLVGAVAYGDADTFVINQDGAVLHRDATSWSYLAAQPGLITATTLFGAPGNSMDLYAAGEDASFKIAMYHSPDRGLTWAKETLPAGAMFIYRGADGTGGTILPAGGSTIFRRGANGAWASETVPANSTGAGSYVAAASETINVVVGGISGSTAAIAYYNSAFGGWNVIPTANITPSTTALNGVCGGTAGWWAVGGSVILHSSGVQPTTWTQQGNGVVAGTLDGCVATDAMHAWAFGSNGAVYVTSNGGTSWSGVTTPPATTAALNAGAHSTGAALTLVGDTGVIFRSTDGGASFTPERTGPQDALSAIFGPSPGNVFAVGNNGAIYTTTNGGATWNKLAAPAATGTTGFLEAVWAASPTDVYAVGASGTIVHSSNGTTFTKYAGANAPTATTTFHDVWGSSQLGVYAIGGDGSGTTATRVVYHSTDHGTTWAPLTIPGFSSAAASNAVGLTVFAIGSDAWVAGDSGLIFHSTDGTTFTQQMTGLTTVGILTLRGVPGHLIATLGTDPGQYISTTNNGTTWVAPTTAAFNDSASHLVFVPDESFIYAFGAFPAVFSSDKGASFMNLLVTVMASGGDVPLIVEIEMAVQVAPRQFSGFEMTRSRHEEELQEVG